MRRTLRRSCTACAKAKLGCDLRTPKCSRCVKRNSKCEYANEPLTSRTRWEADHRETQISKVFDSQTNSALLDGVVLDVSPDMSGMSMFFEAHLFDPFDSYPATSLPRLRVQGLMRHFLSRIAFQYYPLDLNPVSNPFVASWWPLALNDPLLFHVSLQTASWDDELHARKGFPHSELLMNDSLSLLRRKIQDQSLAFQNATMNAVVTLAAIEHGKGNLHASNMHIDGVKRMVSGRGGLLKIKQTSPLTARMVPWVALLVTGSPQFEAEDQYGMGNGVCSIQQWQSVLFVEHSDPALLNFGELDLDPILEKTITNLRSIFGTLRTSTKPGMLSNTDLHDLTLFVLHRLLGLPPFASVDSRSASTSECLRYGASIFMFIIHGPTYYSHAAVLHSLLLQLKSHLEFLTAATPQGSLLLWLLSVGAVAATGTSESIWFRGRLTALSKEKGIQYWEDFKEHLKSILWLEARAQVLFQEMWEDIVI